MDTKEALDRGPVGALFALKNSRGCRRTKAMMAPQRSSTTPSSSAIFERIGGVVSILGRVRYMTPIWPDGGRSMDAVEGWIGGELGRAAVRPSGGRWSGGHRRRGGWGGGVGACRTRGGEWNDRRMVLGVRTVTHPAK